MGRRRSLRTQLAATFLALAVVPPVLFGAASLSYAVGSVRDNVASRNLQVALAVSGEVGQYLDSQVREVRELASGTSDADAAHLEQAARRHLATNPSIRSIVLVDGSGRAEWSAPADPDVVGSDLSAQPYLKEALRRGGPTWSSAAISLQTGLPVVTLVVPGKVRTVVGFIDLGALDAIVARTRLGPEAWSMVVDRDGTVLAHRDPQLVRQQANVRDLEPVGAALAGREGTAEFRFRGKDYLGSAASVPQTNWVVLVAEPAARAYQQVYRMRDLFAVLLVAAVMAAVVAAVLAARHVLRPLEALQASARTMAAGRGPLPPVDERFRGFREIDELTQAFDAMAAAVRAREEELGRSERKYRRLVSAPLVGVARSTMAGEILFCNQGFARMMGFDAAEDLVGRSLVPLYRDPAERARLLQEVTESGRAVNAEVRFATSAGEKVVLLNVVYDEGTLTTVAVDITDRKRADADRERLEQELYHSQRVEAVGRLAGGVAHDFNNILTAILALADELRDSIPPGGPGEEQVDGIVRSARRAAHLTRSLLAYSRKQVLHPRPVDLREVIGRALQMLRPLLGEDIELSVDLPPAPAVVVADPAQIEQVLVNLCTNARDAMPGGGALRISAAPVEVAEGQAREQGLRSGGRYVAVAVRDTGQGMPPDVAARAFEPFFTTKRSGKGTGLGLAIVHGIVRQHEGAVSVESAPDAGTTVHFLLPASSAPPQGVSADAAAPDPPAGGRETILLAEDEELVRKVLGNTLRRAGYQVIEAANGREALDLFQENRDRIALCLLDVVMPLMNGREACEAISRLDPGARILLASGHAADVLETRGLAGGLELIPKPIAPADLLRRVRERLDRAPA